MYQINADLLRTNVLVQNTYMVQQSISVLRAKNRALNDKRKKRKTVGGKGCHHMWVAALLVLQWRSFAGTWQVGKRRVRTEHLEVCRHFRAGISINDNLCQYANYRRSACRWAMQGRNGKGTAERREKGLRIAELKTWRSARENDELERAVALKRLCAGM